MGGKRVGFVGLGLMGHGMAANIVGKGWPVSVVAHRRREAVEDLVARGARELRSARELARESAGAPPRVSTSRQVEADHVPLLSDVVAEADGLPPRP